MMVMAAALAKLILPSVMMTSKFWWRATTWQSDDWFQMQGTVKRGHLMAMNLPKGPPGARHHPGRQRTAREQPATILLPMMRSFGTRKPPIIGTSWDGTLRERTAASELQNRGSIALETRQQIQAEHSPPNLTESESRGA